MKYRNAIIAFLAMCTYLGLAGCDALKQPEHTENKTILKSKISDLILTHGNTENKTLAALPGALVGTAAAITGGLSIPITTAVGGAVGYATHAEATSSPSVTECRFRVSNIVDDKHNLNLSYYGEKKLGGDDFNKCVNLKNDDDIEVIIVTHYEDGKFSYRNYKWRAGNTTGNLQ